ncbi:MAG TPA: hypothetical protein DC049_03335, partial [Spirochaetia bacterium]|nr:hypothetical protein [Spirochaetia bacterium]
MNKNTGCYFFLVLILNIIITKNIQAGWNEFWYRKIITNNFSCSGDLTNFPLLVVISNDASLSAKASNNGHDIAFTGYDGTTRLAHEIEYYDAGTLVAWVRIPLFSAAVQSSNIIYMYYCKDGSGNQQDTQAVWSEKYLTVQHFEETSGTLISDSSSNGYNGTAAGVKTLNTNTVIGSGAALNNGSDGFSLATGVFNPSAGTWSIWYYTDYTAEGTAVRIFNANHSSGSDWEHRDYKSGGNMTRRFYYGNDAYISTSFSLSGWDNKWNQICYTWEYSGGTTTVNVFTNGILTSTYSSANLLINADLNWELGHWQSVSPACVMDEFNTASA